MAARPRPTVPGYPGAGAAHVAGGALGGLPPAPAEETSDHRDRAQRPGHRVRAQRPDRIDISMHCQSFVLRFYTCFRASDVVLKSFFRDHDDKTTQQLLLTFKDPSHETDLVILADFDLSQG